MNKIKTYIGLVFLVVLSITNIAALQVDETTFASESSSFSCVNEWEVVNIPHWACSGNLRDCVEESVDHHNCLFIFWIGSPDIVIME